MNPQPNTPASLNEAVATPTPSDKVMEWQFVPKEATHEMIAAMAKAWQEAVVRDDPHECVAEWRAALLAAPGAAIDAREQIGRWLPIAQAPKNTPVRLYAQGGGFYDADFNPSGSVEGQWTDGTWSGAFWDPVHDTWFRRDDIVPTHFQYLPEPLETLPVQGEQS